MMNEIKLANLERISMASYTYPRSVQGKAGNAYLVVSAVYCADDGCGLLMRMEQSQFISTGAWFIDHDVARAVW